MEHREDADLMLSVLRIAAWPLLVKVPVLAAGLMITGAATISQVVFWRFAQDQESNLRALTGAYLDGLSAAVLPGLIRRDIWEVFEALDGSRSHYAGIEPRYAIVALPDDKVLAASDPRRFRLNSAVPGDLLRRFGAEDGLRVDAQAGRAWMARTVRSDRFPVGRLFAEIDIAELLRARRQILLALVAVNGCLTLTFALGGYFALKQMLRPLSVLMCYVERVRNGSVEPIPEGYQGRIAHEFGQLFDRFNAMARAVSERQTLASQLAEREKYAMLGRLASGMAHEVNNPLGGMLNAIDTIQAHGNDPAVLQTSLDFLKRGLAGIRNVARAALVTYKGGSDTSLLTPSDLDDLPFLVQHETGIRRLHLDWRNRISKPLEVEGPAVRQITLNLLLNACAASPVGGTVAVTASCLNETLQITVADEGPGLPENMAALLNQATSAAAGSQENKGLGLWMTGHLIHRLGGHAKVEYPGVGTRIVVTLPVASMEMLDAAE
jgi:signal transduction histidine kinase